MSTEPMRSALLARFAEFGQDPEADEVAGALLVAELLDPDVDEDDVQQQIADLAATCGARAPWDFLLEQGFRGNFEDYESLANSHLGEVLEERRGLPITLGVLVLAVARGNGHRATGINFPGHFLVQVDETLVDPFAMEPLLIEDALARLPPALRAQPHTELFAPTSAQALILRMLNNVKAIYAGRGAGTLALEALDAQMAILPDEPALQLERGEYLVEIGDVAAARDAFQTALRLLDRRGTAIDQARASLAGHIRRRLRDLAGR